MIELSRDNKIVRLKCEYDIDFREMISNLMVHKFVNLHKPLQVKILKELKLGVFKAPLSMAIERGWVDHEVYTENYLSAKELILFTEIAKNPMTRKDILEKMDVSQSTLGGWLNKLVIKGLIEKYRKISDISHRSVVMYKVTEKGEKILNAAK